VVTLELAYGHGLLPVQVPADNLLGVLLPRQSEEVAAEATLLREALARPIGTARLRDMVRPGQEVAIVTSDMTRPCPSERLLPLVLDELVAGGVSTGAMRVVMALGLHRPMTEAEIETSVGTEVYHRVQVINHDPADTVRLGTTSAGTPVEIFRPLVEADVRICLGNLELHYFAGYSGGAKAILPGCASRATLNANHAMMVRPEAAAGRLAGNPVRTDIEEGTAMLGVNFILNVLVDGRHRIVGAVAGDVTGAHRRGCEMVAQRGIVEIQQRADIVLVSAGGYPKDVNLYQAQKALDNAAYAVRDGGIVILVAECPEGFGNQTCETWMTEASSPDEVLARIQQTFVLGGHKAAAISAVQKRAGVYLVSALPEDLVRRCRMTPFGTLDQATEAAFGALGNAARLLVLPQGGSVLPLIGE
jgi:nickel-dependent lactate racemase